MEGMPASTFRFDSVWLDNCVDGKQHVLRPGVDYPPELPREKIKMRLQQNAKNRGVRVRVWYLDGNVHFVMWDW